MKLFYCYLMLIGLTHGQAINDTACNSVTTLIQKLYDTPGNLLNLNKVFYPAHGKPSNFLRVTYSFQNESGQLEDCNVTYLWAEGGFLLIQPPSIFRYTSLQFNYVGINTNDLSLILPSDCRHLVVDKTSKCKCDDDNDLLDIITLKLKFYAKFTDASNIVHDDQTRAYAICDIKLEGMYYNNYRVILFLFFMFCVPFIFITLTATVLRSFSQSIHTKIAKAPGHQNLVALALTGTFLTYYITGCDVAAVYYAYIGEHQFKNTHNLTNTFNLISAPLLLILDIPSLYIIMLTQIYVCVSNMLGDPSYDKDGWLKRKCMDCCCKKTFQWPFYVIFGRLNQKKLWDSEANEETLNERLVWVVASSLAAPLFSITSHIGFILVAWLTDAERASSAGLVSMAVLIYMFFMFKQCYKANDKMNPKWHCWTIASCLFPCGLALKYGLTCFMFTCCCCCIDEDKPFEKCKNVYVKKEREEDVTEMLQVKNYGAIDIVDSTVNSDEADPKYLNSKTLCILYWYGWLLVAAVAGTLVGFAFLPIVTFDALSRILGTFEVLLLLISILITYKIISLGEPDIHRLLNRLRGAYKGGKKRRTTNCERQQNEYVNDEKKFDSVEAAGHLMGELAEVVIHTLQHLPQATERNERGNERGRNSHTGAN